MGISVLGWSQSNPSVGYSEFSNRSQIKAIEYKMQRIGTVMMEDTSEKLRQKSVYEFIKLLKEALKVDQSFNYQFDSLPFMSVQYPSDSTFRVITFQMTKNTNVVRHYGCIQLNSPKLKVLPLIDCSDTFPVVPQMTMSNKNWFGALYYRILTKKINNKKIYFLFGLDQNDVFSDRKIIEPMWIEGDTIARFGMPIFEKIEKITVPKTKEEMTKKSVFYRYVVEYKQGAGVMLNFDAAMNMIVFDHTKPENEKYATIKFMDIPDGSYEGLRWDGVKWKWESYVKIGEKETNVPIRPVPLIKEKNNMTIPPKQQ
jgi:hypothetical protein